MSSFCLVNSLLYGGDDGDGDDDDDNVESL